MLSTLEAGAPRPRLCDPGCPQPWLSHCSQWCSCAVGETAAHLEQSGAAQLAARAEPGCGRCGWVFQGPEGVRMFLLKLFLFSFAASVTLETSAA